MAETNGDVKKCPRCHELENKVRQAENQAWQASEALRIVDLTRFGGYLMSSQKGAPLCHQHAHLILPS